MRAAVLTADGRLEIVDRAEPVPAAGEVVVGVARCGVCGSDVHLRDSGMLPPGTVLGHEFAGVVAAAAPDGGGPPVGTRVAVLPARRCGTCPACSSGRENLCSLQLGTAIGLGVRDGAYAERVVVPASSCHVLPPSATPTRAALAEPLAVALHALARSRVGAAPDLAVGVIGAGSVGLMCTAALAQAGAGTVAVAEPRPARRAAAAALGARVVEGADGLAGALGRAPDVVFEATGRPEMPGRAVEVAAAGGQVVLLGVATSGFPVEMPGLAWVLKEVDVLGSIAYTDAEFAAAVAAVSAGVVDEIAWRAEIRPLTGAQRALDDLGRADGPVKVLLDPSC